MLFVNRLYIGKYTEFCCEPKIRKQSQWQSQLQ